jgi:putative acetyltransferase
MAKVIRTVMTELGCTADGFAIHDPEVDCMYETYQLPRSAYFIIEDKGHVVGGGGFSPLKGGDEDTCELQKFYILPAYRGLRYGRQLLDECLLVARSQDFRRCYIETMESMDRAAILYLNENFQLIGGPMGNTGHYRCNRFYVKEL